MRGLGESRVGLDRQVLVWERDGEHDDGERSPFDLQPRQNQDDQQNNDLEDDAHTLHAAESHQEDESSRDEDADELSVEIHRHQRSSKNRRHEPWTAHVALT